MMVKELEKYITELKNRNKLFRCIEKYCGSFTASLQKIEVASDRSLKFHFYCSSCGTVYSIEVLNSVLSEQYRKYRSGNIEFNDLKWFLLLIYGFRYGKVKEVSKVEKLLEDIVLSYFDTKKGVGLLWKGFVRNVKKWFR